ncbi:hypothetical protein QL989_19130, partial [Pseudoalteromonas sp. APC 3224]|uniref:hypothetical protein n=1 Tax=Pseudoalteromonas sp. APC 3224 TaxID=3035203 RepID=UPI0025B563B4
VIFLKGVKITMFKSEFHKQFLSLFGYDYAKGAKELGVSERQVRRYVKAGKATKPVEKLLNIIYRGYLPDFGAWSDCRICIHDQTMQTPWGIVLASDVQLVHRYKWSARESEKQYKNIKQSHSEAEKHFDFIQNQLLELVNEISIKKIG